MTVIACISDGGGMTFFGKRVSRDKAVVADVDALSRDGALFVSLYSEGLFSECGVSVIAVTDPFTSAGTGDYVFIEDKSISEHLEKISTLVLYRWNRKYPFDRSLGFEPSECGFTLSSSVDFKGNAHEKITKEIYKR